MCLTLDVECPFKRWLCVFIPPTLIIILMTIDHHDPPHKASKWHLVELRVGMLIPLGIQEKL